MDALGSILQTSGVLVALLAAAGFGLQRNRVTDLREQVSDANTRIDFLVSERADDKALIAEQAGKIADQTTTIATLKSDFAVLQRTVTGEVHWQTMNEVLDAQTALLKKILDALGRQSE